MFLDALSTIGVLLGLIVIISTFSGFGLLLGVILGVLILMISFFLVVILPILFPIFLTSSAVPPARLNGFIVKMNGGTGEAYT